MHDNGLAMYLQCIFLRSGLPHWSLRGPTRRAPERRDQRNQGHGPVMRPLQENARVAKASLVHPRCDLVDVALVDELLAHQPNTLPRGHGVDGVWCHIVCKRWNDCGCMRERNGKKRNTGAEEEYM